MMSLQLQQRQEKAPRKQLAKCSACPRCRSTNLLTEGPDQFCCACDWDTCAEYVEHGLMNNLDLAFREHFPKQAIQTEGQAAMPGEMERSA